MRKNNLVKNLLAAMTLLFASSTMISCQGLVDAVIGSEDNPVAPVVTPIVENTGATAEEVTALLEEALSVKAVQEAIASGDPIKITVAGGSSTTASNSVIEIPMTTSTGNKVAIELTFTDAITTSTSNPLEFVANEGADASSGESENELVITMPDATGLVVNIELPNTTVTLASTGKTVYKTLTAKTAQETLIVDEDVELQEAIIKGGSVEIKKGGKVGTLKINNTKDVTNITMDGNAKTSSENLIDKLVIAEDAVVLIKKTVPDDMRSTDRLFVTSIEGEGNGATLYPDECYRAVYEKDGEFDQSKEIIFFGKMLGVESLKNLTIAPQPMSKEDEEAGCKYQWEELRNLPALVENCIFKFEDVVTFSRGVYAKNCDFTDVIGELNFYPNPEDNTPEFIFNSCKFCTDPFYYPVFLLNDVKGKNVSIIFENCNLTKEQIEKFQLNIPEEVNFVVKVTIDDAVYTAVLGERNEGGYCHFTLKLDE